MQQLPLDACIPMVDWRLPSMADLPQSWVGARRVTIDFETRDEDLDELGPGTHRDPSNNYVVGVAFAISDGPAFYLPTRHAQGRNLPEESVWSYLRDRFAEYDGTVEAANAQYELAWGWRYGVDIANGPNGKRWIRDPQVAEPLIWEHHKSYKLDAIADRWNCERKSENVLREFGALFGIPKKPKYMIKKLLHRLPPEAVADYAVRDVRLPNELLEKLERRIDDEGLRKIYDLESRVTPVLALLRHRGVRVNLDKVDNVERWAKKRERELMAEVERVSGRRVSVDDVNNKGGAIKALFDHVGVKIPWTKDGINFKTGVWEPAKQKLDSTFFQNCGHPLGKLVRSWKEVNKLYTTFCARTKKHAIHHGDEWRVHCTFNQLRVTREYDDDREDESSGKGTRTGRMSSSEYNLQQEYSRSSTAVDPEMFPWFDWTRTKRDDKTGEVKPDPWSLAEAWKDVYEPDRGGKFGNMDYSQQEPRIEVYTAARARLVGAQDAARRWLENPRLDGHQLVVDMIREIAGIDMPRKTVKNARLAMGYGAGEEKTCDMIGVPTVEVVMQWGRDKGKVKTVAGPEGKRIIEAFRASAPFVFALAKLAREEADRRGFVRTLLGRVVHFEPNTMPGSYSRYKRVYAAGNSICQGGAADQGKQALVDLHDAGVYLQGAVHDAFFGTFDGVAQLLAARDVMVRAVPLRATLRTGEIVEVPVVVDAEMGDSYGTCEKVRD